MNIEEHYAAVLATYGRTAHGDPKAAVRAGFLVVHIDACEAAGRAARGKGWRRLECGDGWFCPVAELIRALGKEGE